MTEKKTNIFVAAIGLLAALVILGWWAQLRIDKARMGDESIQMLFDQVSDDMKGQPVSDMSDMANAAGSSGLPVLSEGIPEFRGIEEWLNSAPLTPEDLEGKVVLVDFWTYSCINCIRTLPYITGWNTKYADQGLLIVGMHTPEFAFEKDPDNVRSAIARHGIEYPVALDNDFTTWQAFNNRYWPAKYLFDAQGRLRYTHFGEGKYDVTERNIQLLLEEAGMEAAEGTISFENDVDFTKIGTHETYIGYKRQEYLGSPESVVRDGVGRYSLEGEPDLNRFYLIGLWEIGGERAKTAEVGSRLVFKYFASDANLVMGSPGAPASVEVTLDGAPVEEDFRGDDIEVRDGRTWITVGEERLYSIIATDGDYGAHTLELLFQEEGIEAYAFTFG